jgi:hypothetical protein
MSGVRSVVRLLVRMRGGKGWMIRAGGLDPF